MLVFMLVFLLLNNFFIYLFDPDQGSKIYGTRHVLLHIAGRYDVTSEQLFYMLNISLKYFVALPVAILFISATNPSEFAASLNKIGVPYRIGYAVSIALRYIPDIQRDYHNISQAQQARGVELGKKEKLIKRLKNSVSILLPLIMSSLARVDVISNAMELRGFGKHKKRTWYVERPFQKGDWIALGLGAALLAGIGTGVYASKEEAAAMVHPDLTFHPRMADRDRDLALYGWHRAVERSRGWVEPDK